MADGFGTAAVTNPRFCKLRPTPVAPALLPIDQSHRAFFVCVYARAHGHACVRSHNRHV